MMQTYLPAVLPPVDAVVHVSPAAAEAITRFRELDASLLPRPSDDQINELEELRAAALAELDVEFFTELDVEEAALRETLRDELDRFSAHWARMEQIRALRTWRGHPINYQVAQIPCLSIGTGNGYTKTVSSREMIRALSNTIGGR